jgi:hypothetical protein
MTRTSLLWMGWCAGLVASHFASTLFCIFIGTCSAILLKIALQYWDDRIPALNYNHQRTDNTIARNLSRHRLLNETDQGRPLKAAS